MSEELEAFLQEISNEQPCGDDLEYDPDFIALEQAAKGKPEQQIGDVIQEAEPPDWKEIRKSVEKLLQRTHDLRISIYYLRASMALEGLSGLSKGLQLLSQLTEIYWEDIYPQLDPDDDNDPTERVNILMSLCDFDTFLKPLQKIPLVDSKTFGQFSLWDINLAEGKITGTESNTDLPELSSINAAFQDCDSEILHVNQQSLTDSLECIDNLESFVTDKVGIENAPAFTEVRKILNEMLAVFSTQLDDGVVAFDEVEEKEHAAEVEDTSLAAEKGSVSTNTLSIKNNNDVVRVLKLICEYYKKYEPSSPVPILLERSIRLVGMDFMEIIQDMAPDGVEQVKLFRGMMNEEENED